MKFRALVLELHLPQNFCHRHTDRHFPEVVKSCSKHPKTCKSIKNQKSKICTKPILSSMHIDMQKIKHSDYFLSKILFEKEIQEYGCLVRLFFRCFVAAEFRNCLH